METYILRTHLIDSPGVFFYFKGTDREKGVSFALNAIVGFEATDAAEFNNKQTAKRICNRLNLDKQKLVDAGYSEFELIAK